jgi:hypothetical protein
VDARVRTRQNRVPMSALERRREQILSRLAHHYAAGQLRNSTLEHRIEAAMRARSAMGLREAVWDLPPLDRSGWRDIVGSVLRPSARCSRLVIQLPAVADVRLDETSRTWVIGRSHACDIVIADPAISRRHALLSVRGNRCSIRDLASVNGLELNGRPVTTAILQPGDTLRLGDAVDAVVR